MPGKKKLIISLILFCVHALLLFQEISLNLVLCYKTNGTVNLETATLDFQCPCKPEEVCCDHDHDYEEEAITGVTTQICAQADECFDTPFTDSWKVRNFSPNDNDAPPPAAVAFHPVPREPLTGWFKSSFLSFRQSKFLYNGPPGSAGTILRC